VRSKQYIDALIQETENVSIQRGKHFFKAAATLLRYHFGDYLVTNDHGLIYYFAYMLI